MRPPLRIVAILALSIIVQARGLCQERPAAEDGNLGERLRLLEDRNQLLEERLDELERDHEDGDGGVWETAQGLVTSYDDVTVTFQIFGDVGVRYQNPEEENTSNTVFFMGSAALFASVQMGDHFHVLSESVMAAKGNDTEFDQERLWGSYVYNDLLYLRLGLEHDPISWWNRAYHHGAWLEPTISRPLLARFEGGGGILPLHYAGLEAGGHLGTDAGRIDYFAIVSNGRGVDPSKKQRATDLNDHKAVSAGLSMAPDGLEGFEFGVCGRVDDIPEDSGSLDPRRSRGLDSYIGTAFAVWQLGALAFTSEYAWIEDTSKYDDNVYHHTSGYLQAAWRHGAWTPYTRFDYRDMERGDPFYQPLDRDLDRWEQLLGVRYDFHSNAAAKLEVGVGCAEERRSSGKISNRTLVTAAFQLSWMF